MLIPITQRLIGCHNRRYHAARLRWNSIERLCGDVESSLIDEVVEWSMWHYSSGLSYFFPSITLLIIA